MSMELTRMLETDDIPLAAIRGYVVALRGSAHIAIGVTEYNADAVMDDVIRKCERELIRSRDIHHDKESPLSEQLFHKFQHDILADALNSLYEQRRRNREEMDLRRKHPTPQVLT